ncbi:MAG: hypothetical protein CMJ78_17940 [Planctomycetaceae bacterium]|nr:hypothetical protein [Planctomycetaceae bacterium]
MRFTCPECTNEFEATPGSESQSISCPKRHQDVMAAATIHEEAVADATMAEVCVLDPQPMSEDTELSHGSVIRFLSNLKSQSGDESKTVVVEETSTGDSNSHKMGDLIAKGGMGAVFNARDLNICRNVAMKVMLNPQNADEKALLRFVEEAQITGQLEHPGIVPVHQLGVDKEGNLFYTMKNVRGLTLDDIIRGLKEQDADIVRQYPLGKLLNVFTKVCDSMAFAHSRNVIHRDLKPANIMVGEFGEVLVMDWGLGKVLGESDNEQPLPEGVAPSDASSPGADKTSDSTVADSRVESVRHNSEDDASRTRAGSIMGTPSYMPPEQAQGLIDELDTLADVYSLGAILYNLLLLAPPIGGRSATEVLTNVIRGELITPDVAEKTRTWKLPHCPNDKAPTALTAVAMKALARDKQDRYQSISELQREIEAWQSGFATQAEDAGRWR